LSTTGGANTYSNVVTFSTSNVVYFPTTGGANTYSNVVSLSTTGGANTLQQCCFLVHYWWCQHITAMLFPCPPLVLPTHYSNVVSLSCPPLVVPTHTAVLFPCPPLVVPTHYINVVSLSCPPLVVPTHYSNVVSLSTTGGANTL
jgi:hypothetical protein